MSSQTEAYLYLPATAVGFAHAADGRGTDGYWHALLSCICLGFCLVSGPETAGTSGICSSFVVIGPRLPAFISLSSLNLHLDFEFCGLCQDYCLPKLPIVLLVTWKQPSP